MLLDCLVDSLHALGELASVQAPHLWPLLAASPRHLKANLVLAHLLGAESQSHSQQSSQQVRSSHGSAEGAAKNPAPPLWWSHAVREKRLRLTSAGAHETEQSLGSAFALWSLQHRQLVSQLRMCVPFCSMVGFSVTWLIFYHFVPAS